MAAAMGSDYLIAAVVVGGLIGTLARLTMLKIDYRQYPSYPQGLTIHLALGAVAAFIGSVAAPAIAEREFAAATFLALAATQFREVRNMERQTLLSLETTELVPRGAGYIEGIARVFEARNYLAMLTALLSSTTIVVAGAMGAGIWTAVALGALAGVGTTMVLRRGVGGPHVGDIADVEIVQIEFDGPLLTVAGVIIMNIGLSDAKERYEREGVGVLITPKDRDARETLANIGQRQAIAHDAATLVGVTKEIDEPFFTPLVRRDGVKGHVVMAIIPAEKNHDALLEAVRRVPILESAVRKPSASPAGRIARQSRKHS